MKTIPSFLMALCLLGGLVACGGGSSSGGSGDSTDPRDTESEPLNTETLKGLWIISANFKSVETLSSGEVQFEQGQFLKVFQIASTEKPDEIEIKQCSSDFWDSGEVISFDEPENSYDGLTGGFSLQGEDILFYADSSSHFDATIVSNTEITLPSYSLVLPVSDGSKSITGTAENIVAYKVRNSAGSKLGSISYNSENFDILCTEIIESELRVNSAEGDLISKNLGLIAHGVNYIDGVLNKRVSLIVGKTIDANGQIVEEGTDATIGESVKSFDSFQGSAEISLLFDNDELIFSGELGSTVTFMGDIDE